MHRRLRGQAARAANTALQKAENIENENELLRQLALFRKQQQWIMPLVYVGMKELEGDGSELEPGMDDENPDEEDMDADVETIRLESSATGLYLPSELPAELALEHLHDFIAGQYRRVFVIQTSLQNTKPSVCGSLKIGDQTSRT